MKTNRLRNFLLSLFSAAAPMLCTAHAQNLTQTGFTSVLTPQFMASGTSSRMPVMFRATVSGLTASTTYRYYAQGATNSGTGGASVDFGTTNTGAGNPLLINTSGTTFTYTTSPSVTNAGTYEIFTTDSSGSYTGWFGFVNTGNGRFTAGNLVFPSITIANTSGTVQFRRALNESIKVLAFSTSAGANNGSFLRSTSSATAKNLAVVYDNTAGTGRPLAVTPIESISAAIASVPAAYTTTTGTWNVIIPNNNSSGVQRIEQRSVSSNSLVGFNTDADGSWPTGPINTVNPTNSTTALIIAGADAPLVSTPSITGSATAAAFTTTYGTASSAQTFSVSGSSLTASLIATAPSGFEVSNDGTTFASTASFTQTSGTASGTLSIRLSASAPVTGIYDSQNITLTSTGATTVNIATAASGNLVSAKTLTVTANNVTKAFGATLTGGAGSTAFTSVGLVGAETIGSVTISYGSGAAAGDAAGTYTGSVTASSAVGGTFSASNYSISYVAGDITVSAAPTISTVGSLSAVNTTYGTASPSPASFSVSGGNLTGDLTVAAPSGFEVSTSVGSGYSSNLNLTATSGTVSSTTIYVRLPATAAATTYSGDVTISGGGATTQPVPTVSSTVAPKGLTITGLAAVSREYDASTSATLSGTAAYAGLENSESFSVTGTPVAIFATKTVGTAKPVTVTGYTVPTTNYTVTQPTGLTADITAKALTITGAVVTSRPYNATLAATITCSLSGVIAPDAVTLVGTGTFADANVGTGIAVTSTSTLAGADSANYSLTQPAGLSGDITQASQTITFAALPGKSIGDAPFALTATASSGLSVSYMSSNSSVATIAGNTVTIAGIGTTTIAATQTGNTNYSAATQVDQVLTVNSGPTVLTVGDIAIIAVNATTTDSFAVVLLKDIAASTVINFTDNGFSSGTAGRTGEGFLTFTAPTGLSAGTVLTWTNGMTITGTGWSSANPTNFAFNSGGDQFFVFQGSTANWATQSGVTVLCGVNYGAALLTSGSAAAGTTYQPGTSILPSSAFLNLPSTTANNNYFANGSTAVTSVTLADSKSALFALFGDSTKWFTQSNATGAVTFPTYSFTVGGAPATTLVINDVTVTEGNSGTTTLNFTVTRSDNTTAFTVNYATADGTAIQPGDYTTASGILTFTAGGALTQPVSVTVLGDTTLESDETVLVNLSGLVNTVGTTTLSDAQGIGTILNDEPVITTPLASGNRDVLVPNLDTWPAGGVTVNGSTFVNLGLQGVGRIPANTIDSATGESLGSISDMQVTGFTNNNNGTWSGNFNFLPDRGYNAGAIFSNYAARINAFSFTFTPYTSSTPTTAQNQVAMTFTGSQRFTYDHDANSGTAGVYTTGLLATGKVTLFGTDIPVASGSTIQSDGSVTNRLTMDAEGLILDSRSGKTGSGWVGDEYGAYIYHFNASKQIDGQLMIPAALVPHSAIGITDFAADPPINGRRINQGMEGIAQSPDGTRLFALLQSATLQDSGAGNVGRSNTRLLVYDISGSDVPADPIAQYVIQLPRIDTTGSTTNGSTVDRTGAQSAIHAISNTQFIVLARDGNGRGAAGAPVFKSVLLADISAATNIDGTYDAEGNAVAPGGVLNGTVTPIAWTEALNMLGKLDLNISEVAKFGLNLNAAPGDINSICEKWEALGLVSANDAANPNDYFLFVGNDNDFQSATGVYKDAAGNNQSYNAGLENDTLVLAYRVRIVQPQTPVNTWRLAEFGTTSTTGNLANDADYDNDGIENLVEYGLGTDPTLGTGANGPTALPSALIGDADALLTDRLALRFSLQNPNPTDVTYTVQATDDLGIWTPVASKTGAGAWTWLGGGTNRIVTSGTGPVSVKVGDLVPISGNPKRMMRLKVTNP